jgi:hypothetical protein
MKLCLKCFSTLGALAVVGAFFLAHPLWAKPSADQVLTDMGFSAGDKQRVLNGEFITRDGTAVSERDLSVVMAFLVKTSPDNLSKQIVAGKLITADSQVQAYGKFSPAGSLTDLAGLQITGAVAQTLVNARAGESLNLSSAEIAAFNALQGSTSLQQAAQAQLRQTLLARYQSYRASGLEGIASYDRGNGSVSNPAGELRKASTAARGLQQYLPAFYAVLSEYPRKTMPGLQQHLFWTFYNIDGTPTFVLTHILAAADGNARAVVQRQYYVSTGYNAEQAVAGFLPVQEGTLVAYANHTFTDQVAGFGGSVKRNIGRSVMLKKLKEVFEAARTKATK